MFWYDDRKYIIAFVAIITYVAIGCFVLLKPEPHEWFKFIALVHPLIISL